MRRRAAPTVRDTLAHLEPAAPAPYIARVPARVARAHDGAARSASSSHERAGFQLQELADQIHTVDAPAWERMASELSLPNRWEMSAGEHRRGEGRAGDVRSPRAVGLRGAVLRGACPCPLQSHLPAHPRPLRAEEPPVARVPLPRTFTGAPPRLCFCFDAGGTLSSPSVLLKWPSGGSNASSSPHSIRAHGDDVQDTGKTEAHEVGGQLLLAPAGGIEDGYGADSCDGHTVPRLDAQ